MNTFFQLNDNTFHVYIFTILGGVGFLLLYTIVSFTLVKQNAVSVNGFIKFSSFNRILLTSYKQVIQAFIWLSSLTLAVIFKTNGSLELFGSSNTIQVTLGSLLMSIVINFLICWFLQVRIVEMLEEIVVILILSQFINFIFSLSNLVDIFLMLETLSFIFLIYIIFNENQFKSAYLMYKATVRHSEAMIRYVIVNLLSALILIAGLILIYSTELVLDLNMLTFIYTTQQVYLPINFGQYEEGIGAVLILLSFLIKLSLAPFHRWSFNVYNGLGVDILFFFSIVVKGIYLSVFIFNLWPLMESVVTIIPIFKGFLLITGLLTTVVGIIHGLYETRFNLLIVNSGLINTGYSFIALSLFSSEGIRIALFNIIVYVFSLSLLLTIIKEQNYNLIPYNKQLSPFNSRNSLLICIVLFVLIGLPPFISFFPKLLLVVSLMTAYAPVISLFFLLLITSSAFIYFRWILQIVFVFSASNRNVFQGSLQNWNLTVTTSQFNTKQLTSTLCIYMLGGIMIGDGLLTFLVFDLVHVLV